MLLTHKSHESFGRETNKRRQVRERGRTPSAMTLSAATAAAVARSLNAEASRAGGLRERLVEARDVVKRRDVLKTEVEPLS